MNKNFNDPRWRVDTDHTESWFLRANDPGSPRAVWIKATILSKKVGRCVAEAWCSLFDGTRTQAFRSTVDVSTAVFSSENGSLDIAVAETQWKLDGQRVTSAGSLSRGDVRATWDLALDRVGGPLGAPLCLMPTERLVDAAIPKNKLLTPFPVALASGEVMWSRDGCDECWDLSGWVGMQGHNWGPAHAPEYAWGHCVFWDDRGEPFAMVEGASGRVKLGPVTTPLISLMTVRRGIDEYRFDRIVDTWRQTPNIVFPRWSLAMERSIGEVVVAMEGAPDKMVCLGYDNPSNSRMYCFNSKTAAVTCRVQPTTGPGFSLQSSHGGALEFLKPGEDPQVQPVV